MNSPETDLQQRLLRLRRRLRLAGMGQGLLAWLTVAGVLLSLLCAAAVLHAPVWTAFIALGSAAVVGGIVLLRVLTADLRPSTVALMVENRHPHFADSLVTAVDLMERGPVRCSPRLAEAVVHDAARRLQAVPTRPLLQPARLRRLALLALCSLSLAALTAFVSRESLALMLNPPAEPPALSARITPIDPTAPLRPLLSEVRLEIVPPAYTGLPGETVFEDLTRVEVLPGSTVTISAAVPVRGDVTLEIGALHRPMEQKNERVYHQLTVTTPVTWTMAVVDGDHAHRVGGHIDLREDQPPSVEILSPGTDLELPAITTVPLVVRAQDDYGLQAVVLQYRRADGHAWQELPIGSGGREVVAALDWDLTPLRLRPGESVVYRAAARDNRTVGTPGRGTSRLFRVALADDLPDRPQERVMQAHQKQREALAGLHDELQRMHDTFSDVTESLSGPAGETQAQRDDAARHKLRQTARQLEGQTERIRETLNRLGEEITRHGDASPELADRLQDLQELLREVADRRLEDLLQQLQKAQDAPTTEQLREQVRMTAEAHRELLERLKQLLDLMHEARQEAEITALKREAQELAEKQQALMQQREKASTAPTEAARQAREQEELAKQAESLPHNIEQLADRLFEAQPETARRLDEAVRQLRENKPPEQMSKAAGELRGERPERAAAPQQAALESLQQAAADLTGAQAQAISDDRRQIMQAAQELARHGLHLSERQLQISDQTRRYENLRPDQLLQARETREDLRARQRSVSRGLERLGQRIQDISRRTPLMDPSLAARAAVMQSYSRRIEEDINAGNMSRATQDQGDLTTALNLFVRQLMDANQNLSQASAQMALQEYLKRLEHLSQQQQALNQQTRHQSQGQPMPLPGQQPGDSGMELADLQSEIRQALQKLLQEAGKEGNLSEQLGGVPGEMEDVERALRGGGVTRPVVDRQENIVNKMLSASQSLYEKERQDRTRRAEKPQPFTRPVSPPQLRPSLRQPPDMPASPAWSHRMPLGYESLTRQYFEALARHRATPPGE